MFQVFKGYSVYSSCCPYVLEKDGRDGNTETYPNKSLSFDEKRCTPTSIGFIIMESEGPTRWIVVGFILVVNNPWIRPYIWNGGLALFPWFHALVVVVVPWFTCLPLFSSNDLTKQKRPKGTSRRQAAASFQVWRYVSSKCRWFPEFSFFSCSNCASLNLKWYQSLCVRKSPLTKSSLQHSISLQILLSSLKEPKFKFQMEAY